MWYTLKGKNLLLGSKFFPLSVYLQVEVGKNENGRGGLTECVFIHHMALKYFAISQVVLTLALFCVKCVFHCIVKSCQIISISLNNVIISKCFL